MAGKCFTNQEVIVNKKTYDVDSRCTLGGVHWVDYFLLTKFLAPFLLAPFIVDNFFVAALLTLRGDATLFLLIPAAKSPIAASVATSEDGCDRCRVAALLTVRGDATLLLFIPAAKSPIAATVRGSVATSQDGCDRCRVLNPTDSKGFSTSFVSINVCDAAGMGGLG
jgi:hypothetical protein